MVTTPTVLPCPAVAVPALKSADIPVSRTPTAPAVRPAIAEPAPLPSAPITAPVPRLPASTSASASDSSLLPSLQSGSWDGYEWTDWEGRVNLNTAPNDLIDDEEAFYSVSTHDDMEWIVAYNVEDGSVFWAPWGDHGFGAWEGDEDLVDAPPNFDDETDVFVAGDGSHEWLMSVNMEDMSVFYAEWEGEEFSDWTRAPDLFIPEEWLDYVDLDGDATDGRLTIFATVYDEDDEL